MATRLIETIAALGPASGSEPAIRNLVAKEVNIFKLNLPAVFMKPSSSGFSGFSGFSGSVKWRMSAILL
jgi:hypothetical protein